MVSQKPLILSAMAIALAVSLAQAQNVLFTRDIGGARKDGAFAIAPTPDGGFVATGYTESFAPNSFSAVYLVKTDANGEPEWTRSFDELSPRQNIGMAIRVLDDGYAIAGRAGTNGSFDSFLIRTDAAGNPLWQRAYDAGDDDRAHALASTSDGGFILAGQAWFPDAVFGSYDIYVVKTDAAGHVEWTQTYEYDDGAGAGADTAWAVEEVSTGGYVIAGKTQSSVWDGWLIRTDELGNSIWQRTYQNAGFGAADELRSIQELDDGGFVLSGVYGTNQGDSDMVLVRTDDTGAPMWERTFGMPGFDDVGECVRVLPDGGFIVAGYTSSFGAEGWDLYLVRTDPDGNLLWSDVHGRDGDDRAWSVAVGADKLVAAGWSYSPFNGLGDLYLVGYDDPAFACPADLDGDGDADVNDFFTFLDLFADRDPRADITGDGCIDVNDFFAYLDLFAAGC